MPLAPGTRVGPYEVVSALGVGGMGEVYRARDAKLGRDVALKILPESFARDADRVARFRREAQVLASLNHQHIAQIYGVEGDALVMELVGGPTLADRIAQGPLPLDEALPIARQIADALEAAHEQGIIHRDLKPANIKVRPDGTVKVLDFGLAKLADAGSGIGDQGSGGGGLSLSPTITSPVLVSGAGMILGTAAYMSPEQARGKPVDKRADIWAFGVVLYEMLTGTTLFAGETVTDVLASVVRHDPDLTRVPTSVRPLLRRCLEKDPKRRLRDIGDAMLLLDTPAEPATEAAPARRRPAWMAWALAALGLTTAAGLGIWIYVQPADTEPQATRFSLLPPEGWSLTTSNNSTSVISSTPGPLAVSPDGRRIAFLANTATGRSRLWVRSLDTLLARELPGTDGASQPFWSPDSQFIAFFAGRKLQKIDVTGGPPVVLCDSSDSRGGSWGRDGVILFAEGATGVLMRVASSGGVPVPATTLVAGETGHIRPSFLPDGRQFFYRVQNGGIYASSLGSTARTLIVESPGVSNVAYSQGMLLFMRQSTLMAQPFDPVALTLSGEPVPVATEVQTLGVPGLATFSASATGLLVYQPGVAEGVTQLTWLDATGTAVGTVADKATYNDVLLSPDEKRVAVTIASDSTEHLWLLDLARGVRSRLTFDTAAERSPIWSPDGTRIVFASRRRGNFDLYQKASDGVGPEQVLLADTVDEFPGSWSPDGRFILYRRADGDLWVLPLAGDRKPYPFMQTPSDEAYPQFSPDGQWVAFSSDESGRREVYATPFPGPGRKWQISVEGGNFPRWRNPKEIYFGRSGRFWAAPVTAYDGDLDVGPIRALALGGTARVVGARNVYDVVRNGQRMIAAVAGDQAAAVEPLVVVENWPALLRK